MAGYKNEVSPIKVKSVYKKKDYSVIFVQDLVMSHKEINHGDYPRLRQTFKKIFLSFIILLLKKMNLFNLGSIRTVIWLGDSR